MLVRNACPGEALAVERQDDRAGARGNAHDFAEVALVVRGFARTRAPGTPEPLFSSIGDEEHPARLLEMVHRVAPDHGVDRQHLARPPTAL
jgi:hypothetical protein